MPAAKRRFVASQGFPPPDATNAGGLGFRGCQGVEAGSPKEPAPVGGGQRAESLDLQQRRPDVLAGVPSPHVFGAVAGAVDPAPVRTSVTWLPAGPATA